MAVVAFVLSTIVAGTGVTDTEWAKQPALSAVVSYWSSGFGSPPALVIGTIAAGLVSALTAPRDEE